MAGSGALRRTGLTWRMYAVNGVSAYFIYAVGPATPLLADDLDVSPTAAALHGSSHYDLPGVLR